MSFKPTPKQEEATALIAGPARHILLEGGSRSGKTFLAVWAIVLRALIAPGSRHLIVRFRFNHVITSIWHDTFPKVMASCFPGIVYTQNKTSYFVTLPGGSEIWFGGLDDKERTEKILGNEYATIYPNEASQMPYRSIQTVRTRLAQRVEYKDTATGETRIMRLKMLYDENPPSKGHWTYKEFHLKQSPEDGKPLPNPENYAHILLNPTDNVDNIAPEYLDELRSSSERVKRRFLYGMYADDNPNALFPDETIDKWRVLDGRLPEMVRIVIAVDPSGAGDTDNADNDAIGIVAVGLGTDGNAYLMEDLTVKAGPATWGRIAVSAYDRLMGSVIVGEKNYGGEMVRFTIQTAASNLGVRQPPFKFVTATRGKVVRAEPIAALYEQGKVRHVGYFREMEDELSGFGTNGFIGDKSPNRADALVWALTELFAGIVKQEDQQITGSVHSGYSSRMGFA